MRDSSICSPSLGDTDKDGGRQIRRSQTTRYGLQPASQGRGSGALWSLEVTSQNVTTGTYRRVLWVSLPFRSPRTSRKRNLEGCP